jgi:hypothetical protein
VQRTLGRVRRRRPRPPRLQRRRRGCRIVLASYAALRVVAVDCTVDCTGGCGGALAEQGLPQLHHRRRTRNPAVGVTVEPAGHAGRAAGLGERVGAVDQQRRRPGHARCGCLAHRRRCSDLHRLRGIHHIVSVQSLLRGGQTTRWTIVHPLRPQRPAHRPSRRRIRPDPPRTRTTPRRNAAGVPIAIRCADNHHCDRTAACTWRPSTRTGRFTRRLHDAIASVGSQNIRHRPPRRQP